MNSIKLQGLGTVPAIKAEELKVGMRRVFNYGSTHDVVSVEPKGKMSLSVTTRSNKNGRLHTTTVRRAALVAVVA